MFLYSGKIAISSMALFPRLPCNTKYDQSPSQMQWIHFREPFTRNPVSSQCRTKRSLTFFGFLWWMPL